jgi:UPF0271 protein
MGEDRQVGTVDLNADLGEGFGIWRLGDDDALLAVVTSANVACGFHAGDPATMSRVCRRAAEVGVAIGAQVGYHDLAGFGRRRMDVDPDELSDEVLYQLGALDAFARAAGTHVRYVKPHGALYNTAVHDRAQAEAVARAVAAFGDLAVLGLPGSALLRAVESYGLRAVPEAFADRAYTASGTLVPRGERAALVIDPGQVVTRAVRMAVDHEVVAADGSVVEVDAESICVHGDTPGAVQLARDVRKALAEAGVTLAPFASAPRR